MSLQRRDKRRSCARSIWSGARAALALFAAGTIFAGAAQAQSLEGAYLKARYASLKNDVSAAAVFYREALALDPDEPKLVLPAFYYSLLVGETEAATRLTDQAIALSPGDRLPRLAGVAAAFRAGEFDKAETLLKAEAARHSMLPMTRRLLLAWTAHGKGDRRAAEAILGAPPPAGLLSPADAEAEEKADDARPDWAKSAELGEDVASRRAAREKALRSVYKLFGQLHLGMMAAADGNDEKAVKAFLASKEAAGGWSVQLGREAAGALRRLGRNDEAAAIYEEILAVDPLRPAIVAAKASMERGEKPRPMARSSRDGAAAALYGVGVRLRGEREESAASVYFLQLARWLKPDFYEARFAAAAELAEMDQHDLAAELYAGVPPTTPLGELARIGRAEALARNSDLETARAVLNRLAAAGSKRPGVYLTLGAVESADRRFESCARAYETALTLLKRPNWRALLRLGVCREQAGDWASAEAAFVEALEIEPRQPDVLNHFGYGLVEQGRRLDEARRMLEIAVEERPDSGYIVDSLGWALYRLGDYEAAVPHLEQAVALAPSESVINDHFGDALWKVGRRMEARFQWRRALSFEPTDEERPRIERKLEIGLDKVLAEEGSGEAGTGPKKVEDAGSKRRARANDG